MSRLGLYQDQRVFEALAADYVLGTMRGRARRRFTQLMAERDYIQQAVLAWERRLSPLGDRIAPVEPPLRVWRYIKREISAGGRQRTSVWNKLLLWQATAVTAVLLLAGLIVHHINITRLVLQAPSYVAVLVDERNVPMIVATAAMHPQLIMHPQRLMTMMLQKPDIPPDRDLELWAIPEAGGAPISIGLLSEDQETLMELDEQEISMLPKTGQLAISREPKGGSPTGSPTGPELYQGPLVTL